MAKRKRIAEWLPWYRGRNYKGDLTEAEKHQLDALRMQPTHPAARWEDGRAIARKKTQVE